MKHIHNLAGGAGGGRGDDRADPQDANAHREALDSYEKEQQKGMAAEWARKAEDNTQIDAELERMKAGYIARMTSTWMA